MSRAAGSRRVYVVDDDDAVRDSLAMLFRNGGLSVETFASGDLLLEHARLDEDCCLVLDIRMPGLSGSALHDELKRRRIDAPVIFITGHGDIPMAVEAVKKGAYDFIEKPFDDLHLLAQVRRALEAGSRRSGAGRERLSKLSAREHEVLDRVLQGMPSRQIAGELAISLKTVEFHRGRIMQKLGVRSAAELFRLCLAPGG